MATITVNPGNLSSAYSSAATGDTLILRPGTHDVNFTLGKGITLQAENWTPGMFVTGSYGHNFDALPASQPILRGIMNVTAANAVVRGLAWDARVAALSDPGVCIITGNGVKMEDLRVINRGNGQDGGIFFTLGPHSSPTQTDGIQFRGIRSKDVGDPVRAGGYHDHTFYIKNCINTIIEDSIIYQTTDGYVLHFYPNGDNTIARRLVIYNVPAGMTFSGANDSSTGVSGCRVSSGNVVEDSIIMNATGRNLIESYWGGCTPGAGNIIRNSTVRQEIRGGAGRISTSNGGFSTSGILDVNPQFTDPANGDFTLKSTSPSLGQGPTYIQPGGGGTPPPPSTPPVTNVQVTPGNGQNVVSWTNPAAGTYDSILVRRATGSAPTSTTSGTQVYSGTGTTVTDTGLTNGTQYFYSVWALKGTTYSTAATGSATPSAPAQEPAPGQEKFGQTQIGTNWRGMSENYKRASVFTVAANKQVSAIWCRMRGTGTTTASQPVRAFLYNDATGALLGTSVAQNLAENLTEQWVVFTFTTPVVMPAAGGAIRIGLHSGVWSGTHAGEVQFAALTVAGALPNGADTYSDGTDATWTSPPTDTYQMSIFALTATVSGGPAPVVNPVTSLTATPGNSQVVLSMTNPTGAYDAIVIRRATGAYPATPTDGTQVYNGPGGAGGGTGEIVLETVVTNRDTIWSLAFDDQNRLWWTERAGGVYMLDGATVRTIVTISGTQNLSAEEGLQGLALDPDFATNRFFYVYYSRGSSATTITNRLSRFTFNPATNTGGSEFILIDNIPGYQFHVGGRIKFGPDGYLYVAVGDAANNGSSDATRAQDNNSLCGKLLRVDKTTGAAAPGNPIAGNRLYSKGHRNQQGIAWNTNGDLYTLEHGPTGGTPDANDEVNRIVAGGNYGWPKYYGYNLLNPNSWAQALPITTADVIQPVLSSTNTSTWAPGGCTFYTGTKLGADWQNKLIWTGLGFNAGEGESIYRLPLTGAQLRTPGTLERLYQGQYGRLRDIIQGPDEFLYFCTSNRDGRGDGSADRVIRIRRDTVDASTTVTDTGLTNGTQYFYSVWARTGTTYSPVRQVTATPSGPVTTDPAPGQEKFGKIALGTTWRGMGGDVKRASVFSMPAGKQIKAIWVRMRGTGTTTTVYQPMRAIAYNDATGTLLGVSDLKNVNENITEQWVQFTFSTPAVGPTAGGNVRLGLHTGAYVGTKTGDVQWSAEIITNKLLVANDLFSDGADPNYGTPTLDQYEMSIFALTENVPVASQPPTAATSVTPTVNANGTVSLAIALPADDNRATLKVLRRYVVPADNTLTIGSPTEIYSSNVGPTAQTVNITDSPAKSGTYWYDAYTLNSDANTRKSASVYPVQTIKQPLSVTIGSSGTTVTGSVEAPVDTPETPTAGVTLGRQSLKVYRKSSPWTSNDTAGSTLVQTLEGT